MADLTPYIRAFQLQDGIRTLMRSFNTSHETLQGAAEEAEDAWSKHERAIGDGPDAVGWTDGYAILTTTDLLKLRMVNAWAAASELRAAFIIALYHHWERCVYLWGDRRSSSHADHVRVMKGLGYPPDPDLEKVYRLASLLKHNSDRHGDRVWTLWREVFSPTFTCGPNADWYGGLDLTDDHVNEVADIVGRSGPT